MGEDDIRSALLRDPNEIYIYITTSWHADIQRTT